MKERKISYLLMIILFLVVRNSFAQTDPDFPQLVIDVMCNRKARYLHFLWHNVRDNWNNWNDIQREQVKNLGWEPPRPARDFDATGTAVALTDNDSGEDFLYMHHQMIAMVKQIIADSGDSYELTSWESVPAPGDSEWPVPDSYEIPLNPSLVESISRTKSDEYYQTQLKPLEDMFKDPEQLRRMTLGQLGSRVENTIHNWMHLRFSNESSYGYRPGTVGPFPNIDRQWDDVRYAWLGDTYSSHASPTFWKLHGWVNDRIEDWRRANNIDEIEWKGTWLGGPLDTLIQVVGLEEQNNNNENNEGNNYNPYTNSVSGNEGDETSNEGNNQNSNGNSDEYTKYTVDNTGIPVCSFADVVRVDFMDSVVIYSNSNT